MKTFPEIRNVTSFVRKPWVRFLGLSLAVIFSVLFLYRQFNSLKALIVDININGWLLLYSCGCILFSLFISVFSWKRIALLFGHDFSFLSAARMQFISILNKYIPGYVMQFGSKLFLGNQNGMSFKQTGKAMIFELITTNFIGIIIAFVLLPFVNEIQFWSKANKLIFMIAGIILFLLFSLLIITWYKRSLSRNEIRFIIHNYLLIFIMITTTWLSSGYAFYLLAKSIGMIDLNYIHVLVTLAISIVMGIVVVFIPNGLVVRELAMVYLMKGVLNSNEIVVLSGFYRIELVILEVLSTIMIAYLWKKGNKIRGIL